MKKTLRIMLALALVIAALSVSVSAEGTNGFYDISVPEDSGVTITPYAGAEKTAVDAIDADVNADDADEVYYEGSDRFDVAYTGVTANANYGVILVDGDTLPTASSDIYFIDQVKAEGESIAFEVYPKTIEATKAPMTLYISSSEADEGLVSVPMAYVVGYEKKAEIIYGDINDDKAVNNKDIGYLARHLAGGFTFNFTLNLDAADVKKDGAVNNKDIGVLARYLAGGFYNPNVLPQ